jgi:hypothetical protein
MRLVQIHWKPDTKATEKGFLQKMEFVKQEVVDVRQLGDLKMESSIPHERAHHCDWCPRCQFGGVEGLAGLAGSSSLGCAIGVRLGGQSVGW